MNAEAINKLADFIEEARYRFNMNDIYAEPSNRRGGCIGCQAAILWPEIRRPYIFENAISWSPNKLMRKLQISSYDHGNLCFTSKTSSHEPIALNLITRPAAVEALRNLAKTGKVRFLKQLCLKRET